VGSGAVLEVRGDAKVVLRDARDLRAVAERDVLAQLLAALEQRLVHLRAHDAHGRVPVAVVVADARLAELVPVVRVEAHARVREAARAHRAVHAERGVEHAQRVRREREAAAAVAARGPQLEHGAAHTAPRERDRERGARDAAADDEDVRGECAHGEVWGLGRTHGGGISGARRERSPMMPAH
jgi:hypothetical protein